ncbi:MAG: DUF1553 domain-containing protein [Verrucomicrobiota bacterium]
MTRSILEFSRYGATLLLVAALFAPGTARSADIDAVDFSTRILPIISTKCFHCHGPDESSRKAKLRLDIATEAYKQREGGIVVIKPRDAEHSELVKRITNPDPDEVMPPPDEKHPLKPAEIALLKKWIQQGAVYEKHWAFKNPVRPKLPPVKNKKWVYNEIDRFILAKIEAAKLKPSPPAERSILLRRLSLDLTGLPPTPAEVENFLKNKSPKAFENEVDRLLASPAYGERWARMWLDIARYADSAGYGSDPLRLNVWPYREWVIKAFNRNMPFDQFTIEQLAGDLLENSTEEQKVATGFHRNTMTNTEGGTEDEEWRVAAVKDRAEVTAQAWMGITMGCAQCHTHKFDPITHREYYQFYSFFNQTEDSDKADDSPTMPLPTSEQREKIKRFDAEIAAMEKKLDTASPEVFADLAEWEKTSTASNAWTTLEPIDYKSMAGPTFKKLEDNSLLATNMPPAKDTYTVTLRSTVSNLSALRLEVLADESLPANGPGRNATGNFLLNQFEASYQPNAKAAQQAQFVRIELPGENRILSLAEVQVFKGETNLALKGKATQSSVDFEGPPQLAIDGNTNGNFDVTKTTHTKTENNPWWEVDLGAEQFFDAIMIWNRTDADVGERLAGARVVVLNAKREQLWESKIAEAPKPSVRLAINGEQPIKFARASASFTEKNYSIAATIEEQMQPKMGWSVDGGKGKNQTAIFETVRPLPPGDLTIKLVQNLGKKQTIGRFRISAASLPSPVIVVPEALVPVLAIAPEKRSDEQKTELEKWFREFSPSVSKQAKAVTAVKMERDAIKPLTVPVMHEFPPDKLRSTHLLTRGNYLEPGEAVSPGVPAAFNPWPANAPTNRLGVAEWLMSEENPLTARVTANRFWAQIFGRGIVETEEDFGTQGTKPTHPELLDWLALELRDNGWNIKQFLKKIVMSATYQQSSRVTPELLQKDPGNYLLARAPRHRLDAEMIRDQALALSGLLSAKIGGPSVYPPQPDNLWRAAFNGQRSYDTSKGEDKYRRGLYTIWRRTIPYPSMATFDAPSRETCAFRRLPTNTPLQAYVTLNDPVYVEAAQALGRRLVKEGGATLENKIQFGLRLALARQPTKNEITSLCELYKSELTHYNANEKEAKELATSQVGALPEGLNAAEAAAWTTVANVLLNLDGILTKS